MKIKVSEANNLQLDWLVAKCEGIYWSLNGYFVWNTLGHLVKYSKECPAYSTDWAQGGPIIERGRIAISYHPNPFQPGWKPWTASFATHTYRDDEPLIAAMRCYVASKLGNEVAIPKELV